MKTSMKLIFLAVIIVSASILSMNWNKWVVYPKYYAIVKKHLKDPDSADFRDSFISKNQGYFCGECNSKNSYGGYVGFRRFVIFLGDVAIEGTEIVGSVPSRLDVHKSKMEILNEEISRLKRGERSGHFCSNSELEEKALSMAFEKTWARECVK